MNKIEQLIKDLKYAQQNLELAAKAMKETHRVQRKNLKVMQDGLAVLRERNKPKLEIVK